MKNRELIFIAVLSFTFPKTNFGQIINWASLKNQQKHIVSIQTGWDYGLVYGIGYGYKPKENKSIIYGAEYSFPSGEIIFDDFNIKLGGQFNLYHQNDIRIDAKIQGIYRRFENPLVGLQNFGSKITGVAGYFRTKGFMAAEIGFDKAIVTHFKHTDIFRENNYGQINNGWKLATGGNFNYGIQLGVSLKNQDIGLKLGKTMTENLRSAPLIPYYLQISTNIKLGKFRASASRGA